ncbi:MAG TPA: TolC family protein [Gemmataceae bacterium]|nr:TolC family protein [Gemmataceae bacterium]
MKKGHRNTLLSASLTALCLAGLPATPASAQEAPATITFQEDAPPAAVRLTLEEAKQRALANNKLLNIGGLNAEGKAFAVKAARADYFPKVVGSVMYFHFNDDLGHVFTTQGRTIRGLLGRPLLTFPSTTIQTAVLNEDSSFANVGVLQPITDLLKVRQGVKLAQADQQIAQAELEAGTRKLVSGVEQLYWGLLAARRIRAGAAEGVRGAELLAKTRLLEARTALVEARQGLQQVDKQIADVQEQLNGLLGLPLGTTLELVEPPLPVLPFRGADDVIGLALAASPEIHEAQQTILKAQAAVAAGKLDYVPSIAMVGGYVNQTGASYMQQDIGYVGVVGSNTFVDWGKRKNIVRERQNLVVMASLKLQQTEDDVREQARKAFREVAETQEALKTAQEMVELRKEAEKKETTPEAMRNPAPLLAATQARMLAEVDAVKADLAYRTAYVQLMSLVGQQ